MDQGDRVIASATLNFDDKIVYLRVLNENKIAIVDLSKSFSILDIGTMEKTHSFNLKHAYANNEKKNISFSPDGKYLAYSEEAQSVVRVIDIQKQKLHHSFATQQNKIETLIFDPSSSYLIAGSITGRVYLWNLFFTGQVSRLSSFPEYTPNTLLQSKINYVSAAAFSSSGNLIATSGYGGSIVVTNIHTEVSPKRITPNHVRINSLCFIDENFLCAGNIEGGLDIIDLRVSQIHKHYQTSLGDINTMCLSSSGNYLFVAGHTQQVSLLNLKEHKLVTNEYLRVRSKITHIDITKEDILIVSCEDGSVNFFNLYPQELLKLRLDTSSYQQSFELLQSFPLLLESDLVQELEIAWEETLNEAVFQVQEGDIKAAQRVLNRFAKVPSKTHIINEFQGLITHFERFRIAVKHENYAMAYSMSDHVHLLKMTDPYREMEKTWDSIFLKAQVYVVKEQTHNLFKVLEPFSRVTCKLCFIQVLLHQPEIFFDFTKHINDHSYEHIFSITKQFPCLKEISSYQKVLESSDDLLVKFRQHIFSRDYELADLEHEALKHISYMKKELKELSKLLELAKRLENYFNEGKLLASYTLIDTHPQLQVLPLTKELEKGWNEKMKASEQEALLGHTKEIKLILGELLPLHSRAQKVGMLLRQSYLTQIKFLAIKEQFSLIPKAVINYINIFGFDTELSNLLQKLKKSKNFTIDLTPEQEHRRPRALWLNLTGGKIPDTILQVKQYPN